MAMTNKAWCMSDFKKCKMDCFFRAMDKDCDGVVTERDFMDMADRMCARGNFNETKSKELKSKMKECFCCYFKPLCKGTPATCEVMLNRMCCSDQDKMAEHACFFFDCMFDALDKSNHGKITDKEFCHYFDIIGKSADKEACARTFKMMDADGDGHVSRHEFCSAGADFFKHDEKGMCSDNMFGDVKMTKKMCCSSMKADMTEEEESKEMGACILS